MSVYSWSTTAGTNAGADAAINWAEGQTPSSVNDSARAMMAALAAMIRDQGAYASTAGTSTAYTLSLSQTMASRVPALIGFKAHTTNTGACTLNVDGTGAANLRAVTGTNLVAGAIVSGCVYLATWVSGSSEWLLLNPAVGALPLTGGTLTGALTLSGAPTVDLHASTKKYVDDTKTAIQAVTVTGTGSLTGGGDLTTNRTISVSPGGISATELASDAVTTVKILNANVTPAKLSQPLTVGTATATTSGTSHTFTVPSWARQVKLILSLVSTNSTQHVRVRLGTGGSAVTAGYVSTSQSTAPTTVTATAGFDLADGGLAATSRSGVFTFTPLDDSSNIWMCESLVTQADNVQITTSGYLSVGGTLDRVVLTTANGADTFDAGSANVIYW